MSKTGKSQIVKKIHSAAKMYKNHFIGKTYMFVYDNQFVEVVFKKSSFLHLTGVETKLSAEDFYKHALRKNQLRPSEFFFSTSHPYRLAVRKINCLDRLYELTVDDVLITTDITTTTFSYHLGVTNLEFVICLGDDVNKQGQIASSCKIPYSFRVESIKNSKYDKLFDVTHIFVKSTNDDKYRNLTFGNLDNIENLPDDIRNKIDLVQMNCEKED